MSITLSKLLDEGRASQSQGLVQLATKRALKLATYLEELIDDGNEIIVAEPSVLALFRYDYKKLLNNDKQFDKLANHTYDPIEYINMLIVNCKLDLTKYIANSDLPKPKIFYHGHCQMKTIGAGYVASEFLNPITSSSAF